MDEENEIVQLMRMIERMKTRIEKSEQMMELMATAYQNLAKEPQEESGEQPHDEEGKDDGKGALDNKKKE